MSFFDAITRTVQIDDANSITIRALSYGEENAIKQKHMHVRATAAGEGTATFDPTGVEVDTFAKAIVGWEGPGFDGRNVTPDNVKALPSWIIDKLKEPYNELTTVDEDEKNA